MDVKNERIKKFIEQIKFNKQDKEEIILRIELKGIYYYEKIYNFLKVNKKVLSFDNISSIYMYDKRIRYILFKYICMIEEQYRSKIINNEISEEKINKIIKMTFQNLIDKLNNNKKINDNEKRKLTVIKTMRNKVFHNRFIILLFKNNGEIKINKNLLKVINNIRDLLINNEIKNQFTNDIINAFKKEKSSKYSNNIKYSVIDELKIEYKNNKFVFKYS